MTSAGLLLFLACPVYHNTVEAITGWEFIKASSIFRYTFVVNTAGHAAYFLYCLPRPILFLLWCIGNVSLVFSRRRRTMVLGISMSIPMYIYMLASSAVNYASEYVLWGLYAAMVLTAVSLGIAIKSDRARGDAVGNAAQVSNDDGDEDDDDDGTGE